jgi:OOP family OmpA-OmpF porin
MKQNKIGFLSGTDVMNRQSRTSVVRAATLLKSCDSARVEVGGHTDNLGDPATSQPLSQRRADTVKAVLVRLGVSADRITARGYGQARPLVSNTTFAGRIANRRVEIKTS